MTREEAIIRLKEGEPFSEIFDPVWDEALNMAIKELEQEPKTGHWIKISPAGIYECSECGQNIMTSAICVYKFCNDCGAKMIEPQEIHCNCTDEEIAKSFIEDVEAVKDLLPMAESEE